MSCSATSLRRPGRRLIASALLGLVALTHARAEEEPTEKAPFIDQTLERSAEFYASGMKSLVKEVVKITGTTPDKEAALAKEAQKAVDDKMAKSKRGLWKTWKEMAVDGQIDQVQFWDSYRRLPEAILTPDKSPIWKDALATILSPSQLLLWDAEANQRRGRIEKAINDYLVKGRDAWKLKRIEARKPEGEELITEYQLPEPAALGLRNGIEVIVTQSLSAWGQGLEKQIREYVKSAFLGGAEERIKQLEDGQLNFATTAEPAALEAELVHWKALLKTHLGESLYAQWASREQQRLDRRVRALAMIATAELDKKIRLSPQQRPQVEATLTRVIQTSITKVDAFLQENYANSELLLMVLNGVPTEEMKTLIEADQQVGWRTLASRYSSWWNQFK